jgi:hypothetical protein
LVDASAFSYYPIAALRGAVVPGWENKTTVPLSTETVFGKGSPHQVIAPNKVIELKDGSLVLEKEFEGKTEVPFFVCLTNSLSMPPLIYRNVSWHSARPSHTPCEVMRMIRSRKLVRNSRKCKGMCKRLRKW